MPSNDDWTKIRTTRSSAERHPVGPYKEDWLPADFAVEMTSRRDGLLVEVACRYDGRGRVEVTSLTLAGRPLSSRYLGQVPLSSIVQTAVEHQSAYDGARVGRRENRKPQGEELKLVSRAYWWAYVMWGHPRQAVQKIWGLKPATSSYWLDRADEVYPLPEGRRLGDGEV
jgi:hypothetical protein